ncbi:MAG TPA: ABC-2 family transporter protein [Anaeromyxobacteraceae bacterium]|nr:ABC-2 family transporter protein [Anaeromyxobacteraceae bacterium]
MRRYLALLFVQLRASTALALQYRVEFLGEGLLALFWTLWSLVPLLVVYGHRPAVAGWSFDEALVVMGWFTLMKGILEGAVNPSLTSVVEHIRKGTLDFVLLKPADAQFLVSTAKFEPWRAVDLAAGLALFGVAFHRMGRWPALPDVVKGFVLLACAAVALYSIWILVIAAAFYVVKVDNLSFLFSSIFDAARWPSTVFRGAWRLIFTFVVPLALMTTYPALALLGRLDLLTTALSVLGAALFATFARLVWLRSIGHYTSASS